MSIQGEDTTGRKSMIMTDTVEETVMGGPLEDLPKSVKLKTGARRLASSLQS